MTYLRRSNRPKQGRGTAIIAVAALIVIFGINYLFPRVFPTIFYPVTSVLLKGESASAGFFVYMGEIIQSKYSLVKQNKALSDEVAARDRSLMALDTLKNENETLKIALDRSGKGDFVLGVILTRPPVSPYDTLILDIGSSNGVKVGNKVYAEGNVLIGDVEEVFSGQSKVSLFSTSGRSTQVLVGTSTIAAEAIGKGGGNFFIKLPATAKIVQGATVTVSQIHPHTFGIVGNITFDSSSSLQTILFKSPVNIRELNFVEVDRNSTTATSTSKK
jgi:cell shape-determining protein MreC